MFKLTYYANIFQRPYRPVFEADAVRSDDCSYMKPTDCDILQRRSPSFPWYHNLKMNQQGSTLYR